MSREKMEWVHYESWEGEKNVLAIGDSIVWGAHRYMEERLLGEFGLTTLVCAHGVNEKQFYQCISTLATLNTSDFEVVYFNNGLHPRGQSADEYGENYEKVLSALMKVIPAKKWILGLSTPISNIHTAQWDNSAPITSEAAKTLKELNELVLEYNEKVKIIAEKFELPYYDAYALMDGRSDLKVDPYHYNQEGRKLIADGICDFILNELQK